jgi:hypothetical protein
MTCEWPDRGCSQMLKGRIFPPDYDNAAVARYLRDQASRGFLRGLAGNDQANARYPRQCSAGVNLPTAPNSVSLTLTRDYFGSGADGWHLSIACVTSSSYRHYVLEEVDPWVDLIFGPYRSRVLDVTAEVRSSIGALKDVRHFRLPCDWRDRGDPAVTLDFSGTPVGGKNE